MIIIYGTPTCNWCKQAVALAKDNNLAYEYVDITVSPETMDRFRHVFPEARTVPQILWDDEKIGGYHEFVTRMKETIYNES